jgi:hypothetical protein
MTAPSPEEEVVQLVLEQIEMFKRHKKMDDRDVLECHLRHYRIMALYWEIESHSERGRSAAAAVAKGMWGS